MLGMNKKPNGGGGDIWGEAAKAIFFRAENVQDSVSNMDAQSQKNNMLLIVGLLVIAALMGGVFFVYLKQGK